MNLREQIAGIITGELDDCGYAAEVALGKADRILAIPEIKLALAYIPKRGGYTEISGSGALGGGGKVAKRWVRIK